MGNYKEFNEKKFLLFHNTKKILDSDNQNAIENTPIYNIIFKMEARTNRIRREEVIHSDKTEFAPTEKFFIILRNKRTVLEQKKEKLARKREYFRKNLKQNRDFQFYKSVIISKLQNQIN